MSIIFEALKRIEKEKRDDLAGCSSIVFTVPEDQSRSEAAPSRRRTSLLFAVIGLPLLTALALLARPHLAGHSAARPAPPPPLPPPVIKEVRLEARSILPFAAELSPKAQDGATPKDAPKPKIPELRLKGISHSGGKSWAFINDRMVKLGDEVEGAEVIQILADRVRLKHSGVEFTLSY